MDLMQAFAAKYVKEDHPEVAVGDTVKVHLKSGYKVMLYQDRD